MALAIRTAFIRDHEASVQAGAGIVLDSVPASEWQETRNKAEASVEAVQIAAQLRRAVRHGKNYDDSSPSSFSK